MRTYVVVFLSAVSVSLLLTPIVIRLARWLNVVDRPGLRKVHGSATPRIGGVVIFVAMLAATFPVLILNNRVGILFHQPQVLILLLASALVCLVGLIDDLRNLRPAVKLTGQIAGALLVCAAGARITDIDLGETMTVRFGMLSWPITVLWIVGITNAVNLIDGLDGLAAGLSAIACGVIAVFAIHTDQPVMAVLMLALLGSLMGFLFFNFNPAKIFMGDSGSLFLGFVLAASSVVCVAKTATLVGLALPVLALGIPIFDTLFSMLRRTLERRSLFAPDQSHIHHRFLKMGVGHRRSVLLMYLITLIVAGLGMSMMVLRGQATIIVFVFASVLLVSTFRLVGAVRLGESISTLRKNWAMSQNAKQARRTFENVQLKIREARSFHEWWETVCALAAELDFAWAAVGVAKRNGENETLVWRPSARRLPREKMLTFTVPVQDRRKGVGLEVEVGVRVNGSLELAGRRAALFVRLMDEHSLATLPCDEEQVEWPRLRIREVAARRAAYRPVS